MYGRISSNNSHLRPVSSAQQQPDVCCGVAEIVSCGVRIQLSSILAQREDCSCQADDRVAAKYLQPRRVCRDIASSPAAAVSRGRHPLPCHVTGIDLSPYRSFTLLLSSNSARRSLLKRCRFDHIFVLSIKFPSICRRDGRLYHCA